MTEFCEAYEFVAGKLPSAKLRAIPCEGVVARRRVNSFADGHEATFQLCTRHADLLWVMGYLEVNAGESGGWARPKPGPSPRQDAAEDGRKVSFGPFGRAPTDPLPGRFQARGRPGWDLRGARGSLAGRGPSVPPGG
jgi:hypothetical protein